MSLLSWYMKSVLHSRAILVWYTMTFMTSLLWYTMPYMARPFYPNIRCPPLNINKSSTCKSGENITTVWWAVCGDYFVCGRGRSPLSCRIRSSSTTTNEVISTYSTQTKVVFFLYLNKVIFCDFYIMLKVNKTTIFAQSDPSRHLFVFVSRCLLCADEYTQLRSITRD